MRKNLDDLKLNIGDKFYEQVGPRMVLHHVRGFVDGHVVYRWWSKRWKSWKYGTREAQDMKNWFEVGLYIKYPLPLDTRR